MMPTVVGQENRKQLFLAGLALVFLYEVPFLVLGDRAHLQIHDNLDSIHALRAAFYGKPGSDARGGAPFLLGGLPREAISPALGLPAIFYRVLEPLWAYRANDFVIRLVAFSGMFGLVTHLRPSALPGLALGSALVFSTLPFFGPGGLSVAGLPVLALATLRLMKVSPAEVDYRTGLALLVMAVFPFFSSVGLVGIWLTPLLVLLGGVKLLGRPRNSRLLCGALLLAIGFLAANWAMIAGRFGEGAIPWHREEFQPSRRPLSDLVRDAIAITLIGQHHASANPYPIFWFTLAVVAVVRFWWPKRVGDAASMRSVWGGVAAVLASGVWYVVYHANTWVTLGGGVSWLSDINLSRTYFLLPPVFCWAFFEAASVVASIGRFGPIIAACLLSLQIAVNVRRTNWSEDLISGGSPSWARLSYRAYVSSGAFDEATQLTGAPRATLRIACFGFLPAIANLNGIATVDGYWPMYPLEYKRRFRRVIARELEKSDRLRRYFDEWGSRAYVVSAERGMDFYMPSKDRQVVEALEIDGAALRSLGTTHLFSSIVIGNATSIGLTLLGTARHEDAAIDIHVYALEDRKTSRDARRLDY